MKALRAFLAALLLAVGIVALAQPSEASGGTRHRKADFTCSTLSHFSHKDKSTGEGGEYVNYRWSLRIRNQHCTSPTTYFDDIIDLRVKGKILTGSPECDGDVIGGWKTYRADVGRLGARDPDEVSWNCTSSKSWSFTWDYPANDNEYVGGGDRCVGAHVRWVRPFANDMADDVPQVCF